MVWAQAHYTNTLTQLIFEPIWTWYISPIAQWRFDRKNMFPEIVLVPSKIKLFNPNMNTYFGNLRRKFPNFLFIFSLGYLSRSKQILPTLLFSFQLKTPKQKYVKIPTKSFFIMFPALVYVLLLKKPIQRKSNPTESHWTISGYSLKRCLKNKSLWLR